MATSIYSDKRIEPSEKMLSDDLAGSKKYLECIGKFINIEYGDLTSEWKFSNKKSGWILKLLNEKRNVLFIIPCETYFKTAFTFGDKSADLVFNSELPETIKNNLFEAKKYVEGRTIQIDVKGIADFENIIKLIRIKLSK